MGVRKQGNTCAHLEVGLRLEGALGEMRPKRESVTDRPEDVVVHLLRCLAFLAVDAILRIHGDDRVEHHWVARPLDVSGRWRGIVLLVRVVHLLDLLVRGRVRCSGGGTAGQSHRGVCVVRGTRGE